MAAKYYPLCSSFGVPFNIVTKKKIYLLGYSYYKLSYSDTLPDVISFPSREETIALPQLEEILESDDAIKLQVLLESYPLLPRLLVDRRGRCKQESHELLFGLLLNMGNVKVLERLYAVAVCDGSLDERSMISQRETFGSKTALVHDRIGVQREGPIVVRGIDIVRLVGKGSFGVVFEDMENTLIKYGIVSGEYIREVLCHCMLMTTTGGLTGAESRDSCGINPISFVSPDMIQDHLLQLYPLTPINRAALPTISEDFSLDFPSEACSVDRIAVVIRTLMHSIRELRDRFIMHLDLSTTNVMYCSSKKQVKIIDYGGTIGDDSFLDIGMMVSRVCTRSTRAPEYGSPETLWQRNESSETLSAYYAIMSNIFKAELLNVQPYMKEKECSSQVTQEIATWDAEWKDKNLTFPCDLDSLRRVHMTAHRLPRDRPPLDWILSNGTFEEDSKALEMGTIGSSIRNSHIKNCLERFISQWPKGKQHGLSIEWKLRRDTFIMILLSRINSRGDEGTSCGGLTHHVIPPPYIMTRCIVLYDALRDILIIEASTSEPALVRYMTEEACCPILVNAILYLALAPCKATMIDVEHYTSHPLHVILRVIVKYPHLISIFLSPITAYILLIMEAPVQDNIIDPSESSLVPCTKNSHRIIRCLYNLRRDKRCQPMYGPLLPKIINFVREYMLLIMKEPLVIQGGDEGWWKFLRIRLTRSRTIPASMENELYVDSVIRTWFQ